MQILSNFFSISPPHLHNTLSSWGSGWKHDFAGEIRIFHAIPSKIIELDPTPQHPYLHSGGDRKHDFNIQIKTFHAIPSKSIF